MKKYSKLLVLLLIVAVMSFIGCQPIKKDSTEESSNQETSVTESVLTLSETGLALEVGGSHTLTATLTVNGEAVEEFELEWESSAPGVATVEGGVVNAIAPGSAVITARSGEYEATCSVYVSEPITLEMSATTLDLFEGESETLTVTASNGNEYEYEWESSAPGVATVEGGVVNAIAPGTAVITAKYGAASVSCEVNVYENIVVMQISQSSATIKVNEELQLIVSMSDGSTPAIEWTSSEPGVATVEGGKVVAISAGNTVITATAGEYSATCEVTVENVHELIFLEIEQTEKLLVGQTVELNIIAKANGVEQSIDNVEITGEGFTAEGNVITLTKSGKLSITAKYQGEEMTRTLDCYQEIATKEQFLAIPENFAGYYLLTEDLDFGDAIVPSFATYNGHQVDPAIAFSGIFDGQGHTISNMVTDINTTWNTADRDRGIFGYVNGGAIIRNLSLINMTTGDRASTLVSFTEKDSGCLIENIYLEVSYGGTWGVNTNANNPGGFLVQKLNAGSTMRNCVVVLKVPAGIHAEIESLSNNQGKSKMCGAMVGINAGVMENCFTIYQPEENQALNLIYSNVGETVNCGLFESVEDLWASEADLTVFDTELWNVIENSIPHIGDLAGEIVLDKAEVEVNAGSSYQIKASGKGQLFYATEQEGATVDANGLLTVSAEVESGTVFTVKVWSIYDASKVSTVTVTVADQLIASANLTEVSFKDIIAGGADGEVELVITVKLNGEIIENYEVRSTAIGVAKYENGKVIAVGNGSAAIEVVYEGAVILSVPVTVTNVFTPVYTVEDFNNIYNNRAGYYRLMNDLDFEGAEFSAFSGWTSAFDATTKYVAPFTGIFDGNGYAIKNIVPKHDGDRHPTKFSSDASIFGIIGKGGVIRNLSVIAHAKYRGGVIASLIDNGGLIENCYVEVTVAPTLADYANNKQFGGIVFRTQNNGILRNCVSIINLEKDAAGKHLDLSYASALLHVCYGRASNNYAIVISGESMAALTGTNNTTVVSNNVVFTSLADFYANADLTVLSSDLWNLVEGQYPHIGDLSAEVNASASELEIPAGSGAELVLDCEQTIIVSSNVEGITWANGIVTVANGIAPGTEATITAYCAYDKSKVATVKVTVSALVIEATAELESIANDKFVLGTEASYELGARVTANGEEVEYNLKSTDEKVATVRDGKVYLVGNGSAKILVEYAGSAVLEIPVEVVAYVGIYTREDFEGIFKNQAGKYMLMNDIDFKGETHNAFGSWKYGHDDTSYSFKGIFDGNGHALMNMVIGVDNRHAAAQTDASIFGTVHMGGIVRNLSVLNATVNHRGGVIASGVGATGLIENCFVECTVKALKDAIATNDFGPIAFRAQAGSQIHNCITVVSVAEGVNTTYLGAVVGMNLSTSIVNCQAIVVSGHDLKVYTSEHATVKPGPVIDTAVHAGLDAFYANANLELFTSDLWVFNEGCYPYLGALNASISADTAAVEVPVGFSTEAAFVSTHSFVVTSNVEGFSYKNGVISIAEGVEAGTTAILTATCLFDSSITASITVTASAVEIEATANIESIQNDKYIIGTEKTYELTATVTVNGQATQAYTITSTNEKVATYADGKIALVGDGSASIVVAYNGATVLEIPVKVVGYIAINTKAEFLAIGTDKTSQSKKYILMSDIDFGGATVMSFSSYATRGTMTFTGIFDGNGHVLSNMTIAPTTLGGTSYDVGLFGYMDGGAIVRNLNMVGIKAGQRSAAIANWVASGCIVENCFVELEYIGGNGPNENNPAGGIVGKPQAGGIVRNCVIVYSVAAGVTPTTYHGLLASNNAGTVENCYAIYAGSDITKLVSKGTAATNSAKYATVEEFYANAPLSSFDASVWTFVEGQYPQVGKINATLTAENAEVEIAAGLSANIAFLSTYEFTVSCDTEGVTYKDGVIYVAEGVPAGTVATLTAQSIYDKSATATITVNVFALEIEATAQVESISNDKFVLGSEKTYDLGVNVTIGGEASDNYTVTSSNEKVVTVENGIAKLVGGGNASIIVAYNGSTLIEIPVSVVAYTGIYTIEQFEAIYSNQAGKYMLMNDLDFQGAEFSAFSGWNSAFDKPTFSAFTGIFDGNGYAIKNIVPKHDGARHPSDTSNDASIFGVIGSGGIIRNLKVIANIKYRGGVVASLVNGGGLVENCYVECTVASSVAGISASNCFGGIVFRIQANGVVQNCISVVALEKNDNGETVALNMIGGVLGMRVGKIYNCFSIITTGESVNAILAAHATAAQAGGDVNNASFANATAFAEGADVSSYNTDIWAFGEDGSVALKEGCSVA